jgi:DNA-binding NarL/FixJ family response regulator
MIKSGTQDVIQVFLIDDEAIVRGALTSLIRSWEDFQITGEATVDDAVKGLRSARRDLVLLSLAGCDDVDRATVKAIARICGSSPLLVLVGNCDEAFRQQVARLGASRVMMKTVHPYELQNAIRDLYEAIEPDLPAKLIS